ncbi:hypothetical protein, partial [Oleiphilus sp. HI0128]
MLKLSCLNTLFLIFFLFLAGVSSALQAESNTAQASTNKLLVIDLRDKDWSSKQSFSLDGYWNTYWNR